MRNSGFPIPVGLIALALASILTSTQATGLANTNEVLTTDGYSILIGTILIMACLYDIVRTARHRRAVQGGTGTLPTVVKKLILSAMIAAVVYVLGVSYIGFYVSTFLFLAFFFLSLEEWDRKKILPAIGFALAVNVGCFFVFGWFHIYLPDAWLF